MNKMLFLLFAIMFQGTLFAQISPDEEEWNIYDSQTQTSSVLEIDPDLTSLESYAPLFQEDVPVIASVINGEDWYQVNGRQWPYSAVVHIKRDGIGRCSGAMIGPYTVLTNAHCVYKNIQHSNSTHNNGEMYDPRQLTVYAGGDASSISARATRIYAAPGTNHLDWGYEFMKKDYAILVLDSPIGDKSGYFGAKSARKQKGLAIKVIGFPGTKNSKNPWVSPGKVTELHNGYFYYDADVMGGNSGSPVFMQSDSENIIALNSFGNDTPNDPYNGATHPANGSLLSFINKYRNEKPSAQERQDSKPPKQNPSNSKEKLVDIFRQISR